MVGIVNKPDINYGIWASNGDVAVPSSEKVEIGHIVEKPKKEIVNWIENRQDQFMAYLNQVGIAEWDSKTTYKANVSFVNRSGTVYKAKSQNIDKDPTLNQDIWEISWATYSDFYNLSVRVGNIESIDGQLPYYVQKSNPEFSVKTKGIGYGNIDLSSAFEFSDKVPTVKRDSVIVAEFNGNKSGKDVVTFDDLQELLKIKVGDLYTTTINENPSTRLGYGTWARFAEGRTLVGFSSSTSNSIPEWVKISGGISGEYSNTITIPSGGWIPTDGANLPNPSVSGKLVIGNGKFENNEYLESLAHPREDISVTKTNVQPSVVVFIWIRTS